MMSFTNCSECNRVLEDTNGVALITYYIINGRAICKNCAKKMKGRCEICGDYKGWCKHHTQ